jgi:hypothetical protein
MKRSEIELSGELDRIKREIENIVLKYQDKLPETSVGIKADVIVAAIALQRIGYTEEEAMLLAGLKTK